jgi:Bacterial Ig-like domain (group 3)
MKRSILRGATLALAGGVVTAVSIGVPAHAAVNQYAPSIGTVTLAPPTGGVGGYPQMVTSGVCPASTTYIQGFLDGPGLVGGNLVASSGQMATMNTTGVSASFALQTVAQNKGAVLQNGHYTISVVCDPSYGGAYTGQFDGAFDVTGGTGTGLGTTYTMTGYVAPTSTTTLAVSPASPQNVGTSLTLTATVAASAGGSTAGNVQFMDGATALGSPVATGAGGVATLSTAALAVGTHSLTAVFTSTAGTTGSTSAATSYVINAAPVNTTTTLASSPAAPTTADVVTLTATVGPAGATGTVAFMEGATTVGSAAVSGGSASISLTGLTAGTHSYTAAFTGTGVYQNSTAAATTVTVTAFTGVSTSETITTTIPQGILAINTASTPVNMGPAALNAGATLFVAGPTPINNVTISDSRAGSVGWDCNGQVGNFKGSNPANAINGENLGWAPKTVTVPTSMNVSAGPTVAPANGVATGDLGTAGLKSTSLLATSPKAAHASVGVAVVGADLTLQAPTTTVADTYTATLTLTAI